MGDVAEEVGVAAEEEGARGEDAEQLMAVEVAVADEAGDEAAAPPSGSLPKLPVAAVASEGS